MLESYFAYVTLSKESSMSHKSIDSGFIYFRRSFSQRHPTENILQLRTFPPSKYHQSICLESINKGTKLVNCILFSLEESLNTTPFPIKEVNGSQTSYFNNFLPKYVKHMLWYLTQSTCSIKYYFEGYTYQRVFNGMVDSLKSVTGQFHLTKSNANVFTNHSLIIDIQNCLLCLPQVLRLNIMLAEILSIICSIV